MYSYLCVTWHFLGWTSLQETLKAHTRYNTKSVTLLVLLVTYLVIVTYIFSLCLLIFYMLEFFFLSYLVSAGPFFGVFEQLVLPKKESQQMRPFNYFLLFIFFWFVTSLQCFSTKKYLGSTYLGSTSQNTFLWKTT